MNNLKLDRKTLVIGLVIFVAVMFILPRLQGDSDSNDSNNADDNSGSSSNTSNQPQDSGVDLGTLVTASSLDRDGCATNTTSTFSKSGPIYVIAENSSVPRGTTVFVRLYYQNKAIEDLPLITADQDYNNTCINFVFETTQGASFQTGQYEAEFIVNGNQGPSINFQVR